MLAYAIFESNSVAKLKYNLYMYRVIIILSKGNPPTTLGSMSEDTNEALRGLRSESNQTRRWRCERQVCPVATYRSMRLLELNLLLANGCTLCGRKRTLRVSVRMSVHPAFV